jgi:hypothetical protein
LTPRNSLQNGLGRRISGSFFTETGEHFLTPFPNPDSIEDGLSYANGFHIILGRHG